MGSQIQYDEKVRERILSMKPAVCTGPVPVSEKSRPFGSMRHCREPLDLKASGFLEEEFFISGEAAVYDKTGDRISLIQDPAPYTDRILVRRPEDPGNFSGRVYMDILNATNGFDFEDLWQRIYEWCLANGHIYVGITSKPVNVRALKRFDPERYESLSWPETGRGEAATKEGRMSSDIRCCAQGAFWDILTQTLMLLGGKDGPLRDYDIKELYLSGQSQSGAYLNTYLANLYPAVREVTGLKLADGFINLVGVQFSRSLNQEAEGPLTFLYREEFEPDMPYIGITSEGDYGLFKEFGVGDLAGHTPRDSEHVCYFEVAGAPHYNALCPVILSDEDIIRAGGVPPALPENILEVNPLPLGEYIVTLIERLHDWVTKGIRPSRAPRFVLGEDGIPLRDSDGNVLGGLRSPFLTVPDGSYYGYHPVKGLGAVGQYRQWTEKELEERYGSKEHYYQLFLNELDRQVKEKWLLQECAERIRKCMDRRIL